MRFYLMGTAWLTRLGGGVSALLLIYAVLHVLLDIVLRVGFGTSTHMMSEFVGYAVGAMTFLALAYTEEQNGLIRVGLLRARLSPKNVVRLDVLCLGLTALICGFIGYYIWLMVKRDFIRGRLSIGMAEIPMWIPQAVLLAGIVIFLLQLIASIIRLLSGWRQPDLET